MMTSEEKQLLLKDLCARLPYGVIVWFNNAEETSGQVKLGFYNVAYVTELGDGWWKECKPYLRSLSSMTEEEELDFILKCDSVLRITEKKHTCILSIEEIDWLLAHHFDFRDLIPMGLALEAPEGMYKEE